MRKKQHANSHTKRFTFIKIAIAATLFLLFTLGSFSVLAAEGNIASILSDWFSKKEKEAITEIDETITKTQEEQTERLKKTLQEILAEQQEELTQFLDSEKEKRAEALEAYADELIEEFKSEHSADGTPYVEEMNEIMENAMEQMDTVVEGTETNDEERSDSDADEKSGEDNGAGKNNEENQQE